MVVGVCRLALSLGGVSSLKEKRAVLKSVLERTRQRFNVAAAEVDEQDVHGRAVIGLAVVSEDGRHANAMLDRVVEFVAALGAAPIVERRSEIVHLRDLGTTGTRHDVLGDWDDYAEDEERE